MYTTTDIKTWVVSSGEARPKNEYGDTEPLGSDDDDLYDAVLQRRWSTFEDFADKHKYITDLPDGEYPADQVKVIIQAKLGVNGEYIECSDYGVEAYNQWQTAPASKGSDLFRKVFVGLVDLPLTTEPEKFKENPRNQILIETSAKIASGMWSNPLIIEHFSKKGYQQENLNKVINATAISAANDLISQIG
ncbi:hypothetical protein GCM10023149_30970 [Mucilaginibacter gynuensis]|uniref:Uncharacterized protein n=1 Tax=Mucilaginibacter gynuensis TaxID=1302236 RepID=A0ABP8GNH6_9SPHI